MKGDVSRQRFRPDNRFASVRNQQGRVPLDAELNEAEDIALYLDATTRVDTIGPCGVPKTGGGFALTRLEATLPSGDIHQDFAISSGRIYIDGHLGESPTGVELAVVSATATTLEVAAVTATGTAIARTPTGEAIATLDGELMAAGQWVQLLASGRDAQTLLITAVTAVTVGEQPRSRLTVIPNAGEGTNIPNPGDLDQPRLRRQQTLLHQADFPDFTYSGNEFPATVLAPPALPPLPGAPGRYLVYVDLWQRHLTALEVPDLREIALGGPDTTTRLKTLCPVKLIQVDANDTCADFGPDWHPTADQPRRLKARAQPDPLSDRPCIVPPQAGYRRLENQLYRVEIHRGTDPDDASVVPTFKWSRDNGSLVAQWLNPPTGTSDRLQVDSLGPDDVRRFRPNQWVEITGESHDLHNQSGPLRQLLNAEDDTLVLNAAEAVDSVDFPRLPKIRAWDHQATQDQALDDGAIPIREGEWIELEDGVQVFFEAGGTYTSGDYWLIPARVIGGDVIWPRNDSGEPLLEPPLAIEHHYCSLALLTRDEDGWSETVEDCRPLFPPLTELDDRGCCTRVRVGDDVQQAVDQAIAAGGGCLCLEHGVHIVRGPLRLTNARNLSITGESPVTTLLLVGTNNANLGGIVLENAAHVKLHQFLVVGVETPAAVLLRSAKTVNQHIALTHLNIVNFTSPDKRRMPPCAMRLSAAEQLRLEHCRLFAFVGILSLFGDQLPDLPNDRFTQVEKPEAAEAQPGTVAEKVEEAEDLQRPFGFLQKRTEAVRIPADAPPGTVATDTSIRPPFPGASQIHLQDVEVYFQRCGVWAAIAADWQLYDCTIQGIRPSEKQAAQAEKFRQTVAQLIELEAGAQTSPANLLQGPQALLKLLDEFATIRDQPQGTAIKALIWDQGQIVNSRLWGDRALEVAWWIGGNIHQCDIRSDTVGLSALWLHNSEWSQNTLRCRRGAAIAWAGCHRVVLRHNQVRQSRIGITNVPSDLALTEFLDCLKEIQAAYTNSDDEIPLILWLLLEPLVPLWGLRPIVDTLQRALNQVNFAFPVLYLIAERVFYPLLRWSRQSSLPWPTIALTIDGNDIEAEAACLRLQDFFTLGGMTLRDNRCHTVTGQAVQLTSHPAAANIHIVGMLWRIALTSLTNLSARLAASLTSTIEAPNADFDDASRELLRELAVALKQLTSRFSQWEQESEGFLEADYRLDSNQIRSLQTAIATNLFEIAILNNHITLQERLVTVQDIEILRRTLAKTLLKPLADAVVAGSAEDLAAATAALQADSGTVTQPANLETTAGALTALAIRLKNQAVRTAAKEFSDLLSRSQRSAAEIRAAFEAFKAALLTYISSYGIDVQGAGCRIQDNHMLVGRDVDPNTITRGGIRLSLKLAELMKLLGLANLIQQQLTANDVSAQNTQFSPLLGVTETLVDNNEILGGLGHGIDIQGSQDLPELLFQLKLRNNQIRGMAGCGILVSEEAIAVNLDIEGNRIHNCAYGSEFADPSGIFVQGAVLCRLHHNRINGCGPLQPSPKQPSYAVILQTLYDLHFTDNSIQFNRLGGVLLRDITGAAMVNDNDLSNNDGPCIIWQNAPRSVGEGRFNPSFGVAESRTSAASASSENLQNATVQELIERLSQQTEKTAATTPVLAIALFAKATNRPIPTGPQLLLRAMVQSNQLACFESDTQGFLLSDLRWLTFSNNTIVKVTAPAGGIHQCLQLVVANNQIIIETLATKASPASLQLLNISSGIVVGNASPSNHSIHLLQSPNVRAESNVPDVDRSP